MQRSFGVPIAVFGRFWIDLFFRRKTHLSSSETCIGGCEVAEANVMVLVVIVENETPHLGMTSIWKCCANPQR